MVILNATFKSSFNSKRYEINKKINIANRQLSYFGGVLNDREYGEELRINNIGNKFLLKYKEGYRVTLKELLRQRNFSIYTNSLSSVTDFIQNGITIIYLALKVIAGSITIGSFNMYLSAINQFSTFMISMFNNLIDIKRVELNYKDFDEYMNLPQTMREGKKLPVNNPHDKHSIEFIDVWFKYPNSEKYILKNINIKIEADEKLSVVGENGAGKTTFIKLLTRLYDSTKGDILFDGINIKDLNYEEYMNALSVVFQDFRLFAFSIKENVILKDNEEVSDEEVLKIIEKAGLSENMKKFDKGINTTVYKEFDDNGVELSGGEGRKLSIARALYKNGGIVVLDEPTAALDPRSEYDIYMRFNELIQGKTAIFISHRLSSSRFCDKVAVFEMGEIKEYGTHDSLMEKDGLYAELYNKQAQFYVDVDVK